MTATDTADGDVGSYLEADDRKTLLRFITCGSVDDGKSTLIGRLLYESKLIYDDQLTALEADSRRVGTQGGALDFALLVDGLAAEREQGITIDVAYRFFTTERRKFIVADTPGHEQYTRNMVTGASTADAAVILIDARKRVLTQPGGTPSSSRCSASSTSRSPSTSLTWSATARKCSTASWRSTVSSRPASG
jgi:bifunctional enzyme CysN/CysC